MYNDFVFIISGFLNIFGTIKTVMTVINIDFKNLSIGGTIERLSHPEIDVFTNRKNALNGIAIIFIGFILGIVEKYYKFTLCSFALTGIVVLILLYIARTYFYMQYIFLIQEFDKYLLRNGLPSVIDKLVNGDEIKNIKVPIKFKVDKYIKRL